jgi:hypothetical protein
MKRFFFYFFLFFLSSCATLIEGTRQRVTVNSDPQGADVYINGNKHYQQTPFTLDIPKKETFNGKHSYNYLFKKDAYFNNEFNDKSRISPLAIGGFFVFSLFNLWDWHSGAAYKYSSNVFVTLVPQPYTDKTAETNLINAKKTEPSFTTLTFDENSSYSYFSSDSINYFNRWIYMNKGQKIVGVAIVTKNSANESKNVDISKTHLTGNNTLYPVLGVGTQDFQNRDIYYLDYIADSHPHPELKYKTAGYYHMKDEKSGEYTISVFSGSSFFHILKVPCSVMLLFIVPEDAKKFELENFCDQNLAIELK